MNTRAPVWVALLLASALTGCVRHVVDLRSEAPLQEPPPGSVGLNVVSDDARIWDVYAGDALVCSTPCARFFDERSSLYLESRHGDALYLPYLGHDALEARHALVVAEGHSDAKRVNGIVFTSLGGTGLVTAIALTAVGCSNVDERGGICTAGLITGAVTLPVTAFSIWLLIDSRPKAHVLPVFQPKRANGEPLATILLTPGGVAGTF